MSELARRMDVYWTAAALHVEQLEKAGLVRTVHGGRRRALFAADIPTSISAEAPALLSEPACRRVALAIVDKPGMRVWELCNALGMSERAVYHHVKRLADAELVSAKGVKGYDGLGPTLALLSLLSLNDA